MIFRNLSVGWSKNYKNIFEFNHIYTIYFYVNVYPVYFWASPSGKYSFVVSFIQFIFNWYYSLVRLTFSLNSILIESIQCHFEEYNNRSHWEQSLFFFGNNISLSNCFQSKGLNQRVWSVDINQPFSNSEQQLKSISHGLLFHHSGAAKRLPSNQVTLGKDIFHRDLRILQQCEVQLSMQHIKKYNFVYYYVQLSQQWVKRITNAMEHTNTYLNYDLHYITTKNVNFFVFMLGLYITKKICLSTDLRLVSKLYENLI